MHDRIRAVILDHALLGLTHGTNARLGPALAAVLQALRDDHRQIGVLTNDDASLTALLANEASAFCKELCCAQGRTFDASCAVVLQTPAAFTPAGAHLIMIEPTPSTPIDHAPTLAIARITSVEGLPLALRAIERINAHCTKANRFFARRHYRQAAEHFHDAAEASLAIGDPTRAAALFARAAIAQEHMELWRTTSLAWYRAPLPCSIRQLVKQGRGTTGTPTARTSSTTSQDSTPSTGHSSSPSQQRSPTTGAPTNRRVQPHQSRVPLSSWPNRLRRVARHNRSSRHTLPRGNSRAYHASQHVSNHQHD